jgi:hypothetical protein
VFPKSLKEDSSVIDVKVAKDRAQRVAQIKQLIEDGNRICSQGLSHPNDTTYQELVKEGQAKLQEAAQLRDEFWELYPNALIMNNCPWMARQVTHS